MNERRPSSQRLLIGCALALLAGLAALLMQDRRLPPVDDKPQRSGANGAAAQPRPSQSQPAQSQPAPLPSLERPDPDAVDREPLRGFVARSAVELGTGNEVIIPGVRGLAVRLWSARSEDAPLYLLVPDADTEASAWLPLVVAIGAVMDAHVVAWDAGRLHGRRAAGDVEAVRSWAATRLPKVRKTALIAAGRGLDRVITATGDKPGMIVVAVGGRIVSDPATAIWQRDALPWLFLSVGAPCDDAGVVLPGPPPKMLLATHLGADNAAPGALEPAVRSRMLGWLFALL